MKTTLTFLSLLSLLFLPTLSKAQKAEPTLKKITVETYANEPRGAAKDSKYSFDDFLNSDAGNNNEKRPRNGISERGEQGNTSVVEVMNYTSLSLHIYIDGKFSGVVTSYANISMNVYDGMTELYAIAHFKDKTQKTFGPRQQKLKSSHYVWVLREKKPEAEADSTSKGN